MTSVTSVTSAPSVPPGPGESAATAVGPAAGARPVGRHYRGADITFGTRHGKNEQAAPAFERILGARVTAPADLDTDQFGTFTGDVTRRLAPIETARAKAQLAMSTTGHRYALASEASYGVLPGIGWTGHEEILLFIDGIRGWEIIEGYRTLVTPGTTRRVRDVVEISLDLTHWGWPAQGLIVRPDAGDAVTGGGADMIKGITDGAALAAAIDIAVQRSPTGLAVVEPDLRAHHNPTRRGVLTDLARRLAGRLGTVCAVCGSPGYGRADTVRGLPCRACGTLTDLIRADIHACPSCPHRDARPRAATSADPRYCPDCNP